MPMLDVKSSTGSESVETSKPASRLWSRGSRQPTLARTGRVADWQGGYSRCTAAPNVAMGCVEEKKRRAARARCQGPGPRTQEGRLGRQGQNWLGELSWMGQTGRRAEQAGSRASVPCTWAAAVPSGLAGLQRRGYCNMDDRRLLLVGADVV